MSYVVTAYYRAIPIEHDAVADLLRRAAQASRQEPGCRDYQVHQRIGHVGEFLLYERYDDEAAYEAHQATEHFSTVVLGDIVPRLESRERSFYETLD
jgi:quinol monooxygenase YgiN